MARSYSLTCLNLSPQGFEAPTGAGRPGLLITDKLHCEPVTHLGRRNHTWAGGVEPCQSRRGSSPSTITSCRRDTYGLPDPHTAAGAGVRRSKPRRPTSTPAPRRPVSLASWRGGLSAWAQRLGVSNAQEPQHGYVNSTVDGQRV